MALNDLTKTIPGYKIAESEQVIFPLHLASLDLRTDPRLIKLMSEVSDTIKKKSWTVQHNESEICCLVVKLMHSSRYFGDYDKKMSDDIDLIAGQNNKIDSILNEKIPLHESSLHELVDSELQIKQATKRINKETTAQRLGYRKLESFPKGSFICREDAAVASYVLSKVGIENDYCYGVGWVKGKMAFTGFHAFVQTKSGAIVETTDPKQPYLSTANNGFISKGEIVLVKGSEKNIKTALTYGGGRAGIGDIFKICVSGLSSINDERDRKLEELMSSHLEKKETIYTSHEIKAADKNHNGLLSQVEIDALHKLKREHNNTPVKAAELPKLSAIGRTKISY